MNNPRRGAVLIFTLWATAALTTLGVAQATRLSLQSRMTRNIHDQHQAWFLAWSATQAAAALLSQDLTPHDVLNDPWAKGPAEPVPWDGGGSFRFNLRDEQALLPLNAIPQEILLRLPGFNASAASVLLARRAEGKIVAHLAELLALAAFESAALEQLVPLVTVYGEQGVNVNTAEKTVLEKLGFSEPLAAALEQFRKGPDSVSGNSDDGVLERADVEEIAQKLQAAVAYTMTPEEATVLNGLLQREKPLWGVGSQYFRVQVEGRSGRGIQVRAETVMERNGTLRGWNET